MPSSIHEIVAQAKVPKYDEGFKDVAGSYRFDIEDVGSVMLNVDHGHFVGRDAEPGEPADCVIGASADDFVRIIAGEQNLFTAFMQGRASLQGDLVLAKVFHGILPAPGAGAQPKQTAPVEDRP